MKDIELIQILWDYMRMNPKIEKTAISRKNEIIKIEEWLEMKDNYFIIHG